MFTWTILIVNDHPDGTMYTLHAPRASSPVFDWGMTEPNEENDDDYKDDENFSNEMEPSLVLESMCMSEVYDLYDI